MPASPLIDRQHLTTFEEIELKRACIAVLANIPHSDEMTDDPFRYIASAITTKSQVQFCSEASGSTSHKTTLDVTENENVYSQDTATPSEASGRETIPSTFTTPMTTPGITPADTGKRFSDAGRRPSTGLSSSALRKDNKTLQSGHVYSFLDRPATSGRTQFIRNDARSTAQLTSRSGLTQITTDRMPNDDRLMTRLDFNKSLPSIPDEQKARVHKIEPPDTAVANAKGLSRMMKTIKISNTQKRFQLKARSTSSDALPRIYKPNDACENTMQRKSRFDFSSLFNRRIPPS